MCVHARKKMLIKAIKRHYTPLTNSIVIKLVILCHDDDVVWIFESKSGR